MVKISNPEASAAFNATWDLLDKTDRTAAEDRLMLTLAHTSRYLWQANGGPKQWSIGDWQISRAYAALGQAELARSFAGSALDLATDPALEPFLLAAAHEGMARALALANSPLSAQHADQARKLATALSDPEDAQVILSDLSQHHPDPIA